MLATAVPMQAPRPVALAPPVGVEERRVRVRIDLEERTVVVRRGRERRCLLLADDPELGGWIELGLEPVAQVSVANVIDACLGDPGAERHIRRLSEDGIRRAAERGRAASLRAGRDGLVGPERRRLRGEAAAWQSVSRGLGGELGKAGGEGRVPNLPLRVLYLELEQSKGLTLSAVAFRMGWLTHRSQPGAPSADTGRVARRLGLAPSISNKGRQRPAWASSVSVETAAVLCLGLGVDPHEVDAGWSVEVEVAGAPTEPETAPAPRRLHRVAAVGTRTLERYRAPDGQECELRLVELGERGALLVDQGGGGPDRLVALLDPDEGPTQARATAREYLADPRRDRPGLCRELTGEEADLVAEVGRRSANANHERAAA